MYNLTEHTETQPALTSFSMRKLLELYDNTIAELRRCANISPIQTQGIDEDEVCETALLDFEDIILNQAASAPLRTEDDVLGLLDIWERVTTDNSDGALSASDRIAMNIFRHMNAAQFPKE